MSKVFVSNTASFSSYGITRLTWLIELAALLGSRYYSHPTAANAKSMRSHSATSMLLLLVISHIAINIATTNIAVIPQPPSPARGARSSDAAERDKLSFRTSRSGNPLGGTTRLMLLVYHGLSCFMRVSSCQGSPSFATLFSTFEESCVRQVVSDTWFPPNPISPAGRVRRWRKVLPASLGAVGTTPVAA